MIDEIENLPEVSFIDYITLDDVQRQMVSDYQERYETLTGLEMLERPMQAAIEHISRSDRE